MLCNLSFRLLLQVTEHISIVSMWRDSEVSQEPLESQVSLEKLMTKTTEDLSHQRISILLSLEASKVQLLSLIH
jgi:hypothetical protein